MKKMNMVEKFTAVKAMLSGETVENFSLSDAMEFLDSRIEQANKKSASSGERKPTKEQIANEGIKETIVATLSAIGQPATIGDIQKTCADLADLSNQKMTSLVTQLVKANVVVRTEVKGKAHFAVAE